MHESLQKEGRLSYQLYSLQILQVYRYYKNLQRSKDDFLPMEQNHSTCNIINIIVNMININKMSLLLIKLFIFQMVVQACFY